MCLPSLLQSIRGEETVNVNKPSPVSPQLTARSGQSAQLVQGTHCIWTHVNLHSDFVHPCKGYNHHVIAAWFHSKSEGDITCICLRWLSRLRGWTVAEIFRLSGVMSRCSLLQASQETVMLILLMGRIYDVCRWDGLGAMIYIPSLIKIGSDFQKLVGRINIQTGSKIIS
jgi:hypothetical protein